MSFGKGDSYISFSIWNYESNGRAGWTLAFGWQSVYEKVLAVASLLSGEIKVEPCSKFSSLVMKIVIFPVVIVYGFCALPRLHAPPPNSWLPRRSKRIQAIIFGDGLAVGVVRVGTPLQIYFSSLFRVWIWLPGSRGLKSGFFFLEMNCLPGLLNSIYPKHMRKTARNSKPWKRQQGCHFTLFLKNSHSNAQFYRWIL